ncbi:MAG: FtsQ-type POTRA domain-containing protein [Clostridiales Family XIII bacterium]|jgi:cell division protein FtsQ|nr:FtsQ-type POTRA domain-containing protein [Clostridiales Family XIII bacterium]
MGRTDDDARRRSGRDARRRGGRDARRGSDRDARGKGGRDARDISDREPERPKRKRKKKNFFLNLFIVVLVIVGLYFLATSVLFSINNFTVASSGNHFTASGIVGMSGIKEGDNLWKTRTGRVEERLEKNPYIESATVERKPPGTIAITIEERAENYAIAVDGKFAVVDWSGMVLRLASETPELPLIEGIEVDKAATGSAISPSRELLLADAVKLVEDTEKNGLYFKRVVVAEVNVKAYIYDTLCVKGKLESVGGNLKKVKLVVLDLNKQKIRRGTIIVGDSGNCTFSPEEQ